MSIVDDILREAQRIAARRDNSGRTQAELNRIQSVKENTKAAAKKKKKKKVSNQKEEKKETSAESRRIDRVSRYRGGDNATSATSPDARFDSLNLSSVRPANKGADTQRTQAERDRRESVKENRMATDAEKVSDDVRYNPLIRRPVEMHEDTSPEINNLAEALTRKYFQGFEGAFVGHSDQRNAQIAEDYLTGEYKNRYNPLTKAPVDMQVEDPEKVKRAEEQAKAAGYDSLEEWEIAKANKQMSKNDDFYERKAALDTDVANQKYGTLGNTLTEVAEVIGSMTPTIAAGYLGGAVVGALGLTGKAAWLMQNIVSGAEIGNRVAGQETKYLYDRLVEETKMINGGQQLSIEEYEDSIQKASTAAELVGLAEAGTEMLFGGLDFLGKGLLDDVVTKLGWNMLSPETKQVLRVWRDSTPGRIISEVVKRSGGAIGEGMEEAIMSIVQPVIETNVADVESKVTLENIAKDFGLGAAVSLVVGVPVSVASSTGVVMDAIAEKKSNKEFINAIKNRADELVKEGIITNEEYSSTIAEVEDVFAGKGSLNVPDTQEEVKISGEALDTVYDTYEEASKAMREEAKTKANGERISANYIDNGEVKTFTTAVQNGGLALGTSKTAAPEYQKIAQAKNITERSGYQLNVKEEIIKEVSSLSKSIGKDIIFEYNKSKAIHGGVSEREGKIYVNVNSNQSPARAVIAHEMTHLLEGTDSYDALYQLTKKSYGSSWESKLAEIKANYAAEGKSLNRKINGYAEAETELMAMFVEEKLLTDADTIREVVNTDKTIAQKIIAWINKVIQKLAGNKEQKMLVEARDLWNQALQEEQSGKVKPRTIEEEVTDDAAETLRLSIGINGELAEKATKVNAEDGMVPAKMLKTALKNREQLIKTYDTKLIPDIKSNTEPAIKQNQSYGVSYEPTTICSRSLALEGLVELIAKKYKRPLTSAEQIIIAQESMLYAGDKAECLFCYQANAKRAYENALNKYLADRRDVIRRYNEGMDDETNYRIMMDFNFKTGKFRTGRKDTDRSRARFNTFIEIAKGNLEPVPVDLLINTRTLDESYERTDLPEDYKIQFDQIKEYARGASRAKGRTFYSTYRGEILDFAKKTIEKLNSAFGLRMFSFSEFSPAFMLEYMQVITDASIMGLKMLAYTKEPAFVEVFHGTNIAINVSLAGVENPEGGYDCDGMQSMDWNTAKELRSKYDNVGTVYVAKSDKEVKWALAQDWIDTVIPFHISGGSAAMSKDLGWKNYTSVQSEKSKIQGVKPRAIYPPEFQNDEQTYLDLCEKYNVYPKFNAMRKDKSYKNYMKLVNETRQKPADIKPVQPVFDMEAMDRVMKEFSGEYDAPLGGSRKVLEFAADEISEKVKERRAQMSFFEKNANRKKPATLKELAAEELRFADLEIRRSVGKSEDAEYMEAVESGDMGTAQKLVREAANIAGFTSPKLHHGTKGFGFTQLRTADLEGFDWSPFFATSDPNLAETYSGETERRHLKGGYPKATQDQIDEHLAEYYDVLEKRIRAIDKHLSKFALPRAKDKKRRALMKDARNELANMVEAQDAKTLSEAYNRYIDAVDALEKTAMLPAEEALFEFDEVHKAQREINRIISAEEVFITSKGKLVTDENKEELERRGIDISAINDDEFLDYVKKYIDNDYEILGEEALKKLRTDSYRELLGTADKLSEVVFQKPHFKKDIEKAVKLLRDMPSAKSAEELEEMYNKYSTTVDLMRDNDKEDIFDDSVFDQFIPIVISEQPLSAYMNLQRFGYTDLVFYKDEGIFYRYLTPQEASVELATPGIYSFYANLDGLLEIDGEGKNWNRIDGSKIGKGGYVKTRDVALYARDNGYKGVIIKNIYDSGGETDYYEPGDIYIFFEPASQVKSADTVTYDDNNEVIPLSERFNEENNDIRWSVGSYKAKYKKGDKFHWLGKAVTVDEVIKEKGVPDTYILRYEDGSTYPVKGDELMSDEDVEKYNAKKGNAVFAEDVVEYRVGERVTLGFGEKGYIKDKYRMSGSEYAYTVDLDNGETMTHITADDIVNHMRDIKTLNDGYVPPARKTKAQIEISKNYLVGDTVSYLNERASIVERNNPKGGTLTYTIELDNGDRIEVTADQLQVGVTPELHFDELDKDVQRQWKDAPKDWDGLYDDAYTDLDDIEPPKKRGKENPLELDDVRYMLSDYADMLSDPTAEELEMEWAWTKKLTGQGVSFLKDYVRNIEAASNGNKQLEHRLRELFVKPFQKGKSKYVSGVHTMLDELYDKMQELGIQKESTEAAAVIKYGEKKVVTWERWYDPQAKKKVWRSEVKPYTIEDLKKECPNTWENVVEADRWFRDKYDAYIVRINEVRRGIYGHHFQHREMEINTAREKANQHKESRTSLEAQLYDIEHCLRAKRTQLAVKRNAKDAKVNELEKEIDYNNQYRNTIEDLIEEHKEKEAHYTSLANELEQDLLHGQSWNQKRLKRREDYYHHMREESGFLEDLFMNGRNSEIDPALEGKSVGTKPKAKWSGIFERQGIDPFRYDAVASFIDYIQAAEYAIHMDPVISQFRADIYNIAISTQESRNANKLILWLTNWTNDLSGKTTDHIDRFVQERIGRDNMRRVRKIVSRSKFNAVGINLNSAVAQFGNLPNALAYVQNPQSWGKGLQMYMKWLTKDDAVRRIVKESTFLDERFLDTVMSKFDQRLKDKPEKFASWLLRFGDQHSSFMIWCIAYEDAVRRNKKNPIQIADEITMEAVAGRGVGEVPLQMKSTWTNIIAPFQIEVNNAYQIYKKKVKTMASSKSTKQERVNAGTSFLLLLLGNFVANTISDLLTHRRILFDPIYVLLETIGEWAEGDDEDKNWWDKTRELIGKEIGNIFSNMPYGDLLAYYAFNNEWAREKLFGDYDPTRFGVGNIVLDWGTEFATDLVTGEDIADDLLGFITTFVTPFGGKQLERIVDGLVQEGVLPNIDISTSKLPSIKRQKAPGVYNSKNELQFPVPTFADDPWEAMRAILFGAYTTEYGEKYLGKDRENSKWWENILGWNKIKEQTALSERATAVYNALVADGADQFGIYDTLRNVQNADKIADKRNALLDAISEGTITEEDALNILLGYMTQKNNVESVNKKITAFTDAGLSVTDYLEVSNLYTMIDNNEEYATAQDRANAFVTELAAAGYTADQINDINDVMKYFSHIPANIDKFADMTAAGLSTETSVKVQNAIAALEPLEGKTSVSELQKAEAIAGLNLSAEEELAAMSLALTESTYTKYKVVSNYGVTAQTWVDFKNALAAADADNNSNGSYDKEEKMAALDSLNVSNETRAALWQTMDNMMYNTEKDTSWKAARNPYSSSVGAAVIDSCIEAKAALQAEKEASGESAYGNPVGFELTEDKISSPYGYRVHPISGKWKMHTGIDIPAKQGEPILAAGAGTVVKVVSSDSGYGNHVIIEHEDGTQTLYAHMYSYGVEEGQTVSKGEQIGEVGSTGTSTGNHLHFEVRVDGKAVNPQSVFDLTGEGIMTSTDYTPLVSGGGSSNGGSSGGSSRSGSTASVGSRTSQVASNRQSGGLTLPSVGGSRGNGGGNRSSVPVVGRSTSAPTYGSMGITLPKASDYTPNRRSISSSVATTQRTGRTGGSFWDDNILS